MTSHDVVSMLKHKFKLDKVGHTGTLDPFASGLLIVCVGKATKLSFLLADANKSYEGTIVFGKHYDTYDVTGQVIHEKEVKLQENSVRQVVETFIGGYDQEPPMHSAIKIDGQKLYHLARQGKTVNRPKRAVMIHQFHIRSFRAQSLAFDVHVSKGTYIRSLAVDIASALGTYGALSTLRRTAIGTYQLKDAKTIDDITTDDLITLEDYFKDYPKVVLNDYMTNLVKHGIILDERQTTIHKPFVVHNEHGQFIAYYEPVDEHQYKPVLIR